MKRDSPYDTPVEDIIKSIANGTLVQEAQKKKAPKTSSKTPNVSHYSFAKERWSLFFNILFIVIAIASAILLKPESAFVVIFGVAIIAAIMSRVGFGHLATGRSPYKPLLIVFGILSFVPFIVVSSLIATKDQNVLYYLNKNSHSGFFVDSIITFVAVFIYFLFTIIRKTKPSSSDMDNSNAFAYFLLKFMAVTAAAVGGFFAGITIISEGTLFGMELDTTNGFISWFVTVAVNALTPVLTALTCIILRIIRGSGS